MVVTRKNPPCALSHYSITSRAIWPALNRPLLHRTCWFMPKRQHQVSPKFRSAPVYEFTDSPFHQEIVPLAAKRRSMAMEGVGSDSWSLSQSGKHIEQMKIYWDLYVANTGIHAAQLRYGVCIYIHWLLNVYVYVIYIYILMCIICI